jgi:hypothetical protein
MHDELLAHGRMDNFLGLQRKSSEPQKGPVYSDSDIYNVDRGRWIRVAGSRPTGAKVDNRHDDS